MIKSLRKQSDCIERRAFLESHKKFQGRLNNECKARYQFLQQRKKGEKHSKSKKIDIVASCVQKPYQTTSDSPQRESSTINSGN